MNTVGLNQFVFDSLGTVVARAGKCAAGSTEPAKTWRLITVPSAAYQTEEGLVSSTAPIFVLGFYRGGTTLLQRLLNCFQDLSIWGEHAGFLREFANAYRAISSSPLQKVNATGYATFNAYAGQFISWANGFDADEFLAWQRTCIHRLFDIPPHVRWGFKEIRYNQLEIMRYLLELYPNCRILFLTRMPEDILISRILVRWEKRFQEPADIERYCRDFEVEWQTALDAAEYLQASTHNLMCINYETLLEQRRFPNELLDFLGLDPRKLNQRLFDTALNTRAGSSFGDVRNRRLAGKEVALRVDCVKEFVANSIVLVLQRHGKDALVPGNASRPHGLQQKHASSVNPSR